MSYIDTPPVSESSVEPEMKVDKLLREFYLTSSAFSVEEPERINIGGGKSLCVEPLNPGEQAADLEIILGMGLDEDAVTEFMAILFERGTAVLRQKDGEAIVLLELGIDEAYDEEYETETGMQVAVSEVRDVRAKLKEAMGNN